VWRKRNTIEAALRVCCQKSTSRRDQSSAFEGLSRWHATYCSMFR
jgi:hypothetical protein